MDKNKHKSGEFCSVDVLCGTGYGVPHVYKEHSKPRISRQTNDNTESIKEVAFKALESINGGKIKVIKQTLDQMEYDVDQDMLEENLKKNKSIVRYKCLECYKNSIHIYKYVIITILTVLSLAVGVNELKPFIGNASVGLPYFNVYQTSNDPASYNDSLISKENNIINSSIYNVLINQTDENNFQSVNLTKNNVLLNEHSPYEYNKSKPELFPNNIIEIKNYTFNILRDYNVTTELSAV